MSAPFPSFYRLLSQYRLSYPLQDAIVHGDTRIGFETLWERVNRLANGLAASGVQQGDRLLWLGQNHPGVIETFLACSRLGATLCVANWRQTAAEIRFVIDDYDPRVVFWQQEDFEATVTEARQALSTTPEHWVVIDGEGKDSYSELLAAHPADATDTPADPATDRALLVLYTAAFSGRPNGAQLSEPGIFLQSLVHVNVFEASSDTRTLVSGPTFHIASWLDLLPTFIAGGCLCVASRGDAGELLELMYRERLTNGTLQPVTAKKIVELNTERQLDITRFRSALNLPGWNEMVSPGPGISGCGQTEVVGPVIVGAFAGEGSTPFCGRPAPMVEARVVDENGKLVPVGEVGELVIRGPVAGLGYWNRPELNAERLSPEGWWHTRDLARRDRDGTISFVGPKAQMLKSGGENIYASEVEIALKSHPAVAQAAIIGTPDTDWGQLVTAVVVLTPGAEESEETLRDHVREQIARYKVPRVMHFTDQLPMDGGGIDYKALDAKFGGGGYPGEKSADRSNIGASTARRNP